MPIQCDIVTQERVVFSGQVDMVIAPGSEGEMGILPNHAPLLTTLDYGELRVKVGSQEQFFAIGGGVLEVAPDHVTVLADSAERADEIDAGRAERARERAGTFMEEGPSGGMMVDPEVLREATIAMRRAQVRLKVARRRSRTAQIGN